MPINNVFNGVSHLKIILRLANQLSAFTAAIVVATFNVIKNVGIAAALDDNGIGQLYCL